MVSEEKRIANYVNILRSSGLKATELRLGILRFLDKNHGPFSAGDIHQQLGRSGNITTVYRCLEKFVEKGLVVECDFSDGVVRYERAGNHKNHHHHLICKVCRTWIKVDICLGGSALADLEKTGYTDITHKLEFFGRCPACH